MSNLVGNSTSIDDTNGNVTYVPTGQWISHQNVGSTFHLYQNTETFSSIPNATATVKFYGNAIEYWVNQGPYHDPCIISVNGNEITTVNSYAAADDVPILLYSQNNLTLGDHVLEVKVANPSTPNVCEIDRFVANITTGTSSERASGSQSASNGVSTAGNGGGISRSSIAARASIFGVVGAFSLCVFLFGVWFYMSSWRKARRIPVTHSTTA